MNTKDTQEKDLPLYISYIQPEPRIDYGVVVEFMYVNFLGFIVLLLLPVLAIMKIYDSLKSRMPKPLWVNGEIPLTGNHPLDNSDNGKYLEPPEFLDDYICFYPRTGERLSR